MPTSESSPSTYLAALTNKQLLLVKGPDSSKFLQGQVTCDIKELSATTTRIGAQCNAKGRMLLSFRALQMDSETIALRMPTDMIESAQTTLGKYIVFSKAKLQVASDYAVFGLYGAGAAALAATFFPELPIENDGWTTNEGSYLIQLDSDRFECWIANTTIERFQKLIAAQTQNATQQDWQLLDIAAGIADIQPNTFELFTPQELNYQLINGINFRKGCYTGQEIVARLHYRGKLKRHMYRFETTTTDTAISGAAVINGSTQQQVGQVVIAATKQNKTELLISLLDEHLNQIQLENSPEKLTLLTLPYAIPRAEDASE